MLRTTSGSRISFRESISLGLLILGLGPSAIAGQELTAPPLTVFVSPWARDVVDVRAGIGHVLVILRDVIAPSRSIAGAHVYFLRTLEERSRMSGSPVVSDKEGHVSIQAVPAGDRFLFVRAIGYKALQIPIKVVAGCTAQVEVYLAQDPWCLGESRDCMAAPPRATLTVCKPDA